MRSPSWLMTDVHMLKFKHSIRCLQHSDHGRRRGTGTIEGFTSFVAAFDGWCDLVMVTIRTAVAVTNTHFII